MNPRVWLFYIFDQGACMSYQTPDACNWQPTQLYAYEGEDTSQIDAWLLGKLGDGNVLRALYNPDTGQVDAWAQPKLILPPRFELGPHRRLWQGLAGIDDPDEHGSGTSEPHGRDQYGF